MTLFAHLNTSCNSNGVSVQEEKLNTDVQDGGNEDHLGSECFSYFSFTSHLNTSNEVSMQLTFGVWRIKSKYIFSIAALAVILDFQSERF